jgi:hypothetical protein
MKSLPVQPRLPRIAYILDNLKRIESELLQILRASGAKNLAVFEAHAFVGQAIRSLPKDAAPIPVV